MCGIFAVTANQNICSNLIKGLHRLEYRGYDSSGIAIIDKNNNIDCIKTEGRVSDLEKIVLQQSPVSNIGIAHTRWATHGAPTNFNAHPHVSANRIALVHNGVIENYKELSDELNQQGYEFKSHTDTEVVAHLIHSKITTMKTEDAISYAVTRLKGAFAFAIIDTQRPDTVFAYCQDSPVIVGKAEHGYYISSDQLALVDSATHCVALDFGELVTITHDSIKISKNNKIIQKPFKENSHSAEDLAKGDYSTYTEKEIHEQMICVNECLEGRIDGGKLVDNIIGANSDDLLLQVQHIQIIACGTSYHSGMVAQHWFETISSLPTRIDIASEFIYRRLPQQANTLIITISQSGETADTIYALRKIKLENPLASLAITNRAESTLVNESDYCMLTHAGPEIGVASTKAFTTQLTALLLLALKISSLKKNQSITQKLIDELIQLPQDISKVLEQSKRSTDTIKTFFKNKKNALFLGRGIHYPIAMEGALKLKELSYIHAEAYPAGELKHGPLAMVDENMPVVAVAPNDELFDKLKTNIHEVQARGGKLLVFADNNANYTDLSALSGEVTVIPLPIRSKLTSPILCTIPLQWLAYQVALNRGTDIDKPRNLAKSVTVE